LGFGYLKNEFPAFDFSNLTVHDFNKASIIVIVGVLTVVVFYASMKMVSFGKSSRIIYLKDKKTNISSIKNSFIFLMLIVSVCVCIPFVLKNYNDFLNIVSAKNISGLSGSVASRGEATSNYLVTLFIYNILPAFSLVAYLALLERPSFRKFFVFLLYFFMSSISLIFTYQKRPLLVFYGGLILASYLYKVYSKGIANGYQVDFFKLIFRLKWGIIFILSVLFLFYYFYTGARFLHSPIDLIYVIFVFVFTRLIGRLSIPAAMYVNYFPSFHDFYGLSNIGLFSKIFGMNLFLDSQVAFSHFSVDPIHGSLAASVFIDAYGQGGVFLPIVYGFILAIIIFIIDGLVSRSISSASRSFLILSGLIFVYYLSQASIFRSLLGYGGFFYFTVWLLLFKLKITNFSQDL
jgi:hypothetical protein